MRYPITPPLAAFLIAALSVMAAMVARLSRLSLLCLTLARAAGWTAPLGSVRYQGSVRHAVGPRMSGDRSDSLSAEFERLAAARSGTVFGSAPDLLRERKLEHSWVLIFNAGQDDEGLYTLQGSEASVQQHGNDGTYVLAFEQHEEACRFGMMLQVRRALSLSCAPLVPLLPRCLAPTRVQPTLCRRKGSTWRPRRSGRRSC